MGKSSGSSPQAPDYAALAKQQADLNQQAANQQTVANRPYQSTPYGTTEWTQNADGSWDQYTDLNPQDQVLLDAQRAFNYQRQNIASDMLDNATTSLGTPLDTSKLPEIPGYDFSALAQPDPNAVTQGLGAQGSIDPAKLGQYGSIDLSQLGPMASVDLGSLGAQGSYDPSKLGLFGSLNTSSLPQLKGIDLSNQTKLDPGFGAVEQVRNAMMSRLAPDLAKQRAAEVNRLKIQGINEGDEAFQTNMQRLDRADTDAQMQALLGATNAYGDIFNRGLAANAQDFSQQLAQANLSDAQRAQLFGEQSTAAQLANATRGQQFGEQTAAAQLANANRSQQLNEQQALANVLRGNRSQQLTEQGANAALLNQIRGQQFGEQSTEANLANTNRSTQFNENSAIQSMLSALRGQQFSEQGANAQLQAQRRQQGLAEQQTLRQSPLDDYLKLTQGISPASPTMPSFAMGTPYTGENAMGAAQNSYQAQLDAYNAAQAQQSNFNNGLFSLGSSFLSNPNAGGMMKSAGSALGSLMGMFGSSGSAAGGSSLLDAGIEALPFIFA